MKFKTVILTTITLFLLPSLTYAVFFNKHTSSNNTFSATTLDSEIESEFEQPVTIYLSYKDPQSFSFVLTNIGQLTTANSFQAVKITNEELASKINVVATLDEIETIYKGPLDKLEAIDYLKQKPKESNKIYFTLEISKEDLEETAGMELDFVVRNHAGQYSGIQNYGFFDKEDIHVKVINPLPIVLPLKNPLSIEENIVEKILNNE